MKMVGLPAARVAELLGTPKCSGLLHYSIPNVALDAETVGMIKRLRKLGMKMGAIATQCGVSKTTVWNVLNTP